MPFYGCVVWDPHLVKHKEQLEKFQLLPRIASKKWSESANTLNSHFNLPSPFFEKKLPQVIVFV